MRRRDFISGIAGSAAAWPLAAHSQQPTMPVIGYVYGSSTSIGEGRLRGFRQGLGETGFIEGRNVVIEHRSVEGSGNQYPALVADLVARRVAVIIAGGELAAQAAKAATTAIPIVFVGGSDPVSIGLVASLNQPGGNITGVTSLNVQLTPKRLQILKELIPSATTLAVLLNPTDTGFSQQLKDLAEAALTLGVELVILPANTPREIDEAFEIAAKRQIGGVVIGASSLFNLRSDHFGALATHNAVPTIFQTREFVASGGLISYGGNISDAYRVAGGYVGRILKGDKPADLPVQQSTKIEMFINLKTAKTLGLNIPLPLLGRADEVIE